MASAPEMDAIGLLCTVIDSDGLDTQPGALPVKLKVTVPTLTPVTIPALVIVATIGFVEAHVPPILGMKVVVPPIQISSCPVRVTVGLVFTMISVEGKELHPLEVEVKTKFPFPGNTPVTIPAFEIGNDTGLFDTHVPPVLGMKVVVPPTQI